MEIQLFQYFHVCRSLVVSCSCLYMFMVTLKWGKIVGDFSVTKFILVYWNVWIINGVKCSSVKSGGAECTLVFEMKFDLGLIEGTPRGRELVGSSCECVGFWWYSTEHSSRRELCDSLREIRLPKVVDIKKVFRDAKVRLATRE